MRASIQKGRARRYVLALALALSLSAPSARATDVYTDKTTFLNHVQTGYYRETFDSLPEFDVVDTPASFSGNGFSFDATTAADVLYGISVGAGDNALSTNLEQDDIVLSFTSGNVTAIGGSFFQTDINGVAQPGDVTVTLNDGTSKVLTSTETDPQPFVGFTTTPTQFITSLTMSTPANWNTINNLYVGQVVPGPDSLVVFLGAGLSSAGLLFRRRRK